MSSSTSIYHPYVYKVIDRETGEFYIGSRTSKSRKYSSELDILMYKTSSKYVKENFHKFDAFIIAEFFDKKDAFDFEQSLILESIKDPLCLNKQWCAEGKTIVRCDYDKQTEEEKIKHRKNLSISHIKFWESASEDFKIKHRKRTSKSSSEKWASYTEEERLAHGKKIKESFEKMSEEKRMERSNNIKAKSSSPCMIYGILYESRNEAAKALGLKLSKLRKLLNSGDSDFIPIKPSKRKCIPVIINGIEYESIRHASRVLGIDRKKIKDLL